LKHQPLDLFTASSLAAQGFLNLPFIPTVHQKSPPPSLEQLSLVLESKTKINPLTKQTEMTQSGSS